VLFHFGIRMGYTPETLSRAMLAKFKTRFDDAAIDAAMKGVWG
jgi:hypothetical protein